jgi:flagellum-specific ATP synthase
MPLKAMRERLGSEKLTTVFGTVTKISPTVIIAEGLHVSIGDTVLMVSETSGAEALGMVSEVERNRFFITPFRFVEGFAPGTRSISAKAGW